MRDAAERLALTLAQGGMQKSTARVLTALLYTEQDTMTSADLREQLQISSGGVSAAVKQLLPIGFIERVPAPGSRRDHYRFRSGAWAGLMSQQNEVLRTMTAAAEEGLAAAPDESATAERLREMQDFYTYMSEQMVPLIERWREQYEARQGSRA
ncbi:MarR family transcriptional regulator [Myceligenerans sp. TRM 65318]|uniref:MarR family transcriptional regulator n=1 Tax=Myceligenerans pegani TaxID=2776917 RepID=A0ABR9N1M6_9MICO|nr:MarR family transcriptional regulator [Myceligenerans sp. TRM 65318]MBE3019830.1 MarR family transcriptional regulator [Myceligenerans sp. TRM 65318]